MNKTLSSNVDITLGNFGFDTREMELVHRQFAGTRSKLICNLDELLRSWAMAGSSNPSLSFDYYLVARTRDGKALRRNQLYRSDHAQVTFMYMSEPIEMSRENRIVLNNPADIIKVYDYGFSVGKNVAPRETVASYFSLREFVAQVAREAVYAEVEGQTLSMYFKDGESHYLAQPTMDYFPNMNEFAQSLNQQEAVTQ
jgi:hypothetical protein